MAHVMFCPLEYKRIRKVIVKNETQKRQILIVTKTLKTFKSLSDEYSMTLKFNSTKKESISMLRKQNHWSLLIKIWGLIKPIIIHLNWECYSNNLISVV
jgi:hypothetical protein